jgi:hypothetical protein
MGDGISTIFSYGRLAIGEWEIFPESIAKQLDGAEVLRIAQFLVKHSRVDPMYDNLRLSRLLIHPGRRGTTGNLYTMGRWGDTYELFHHSCYRFHHEADYDQLSTANPIMSTISVRAAAHVLNCFAAATSDTLDRNAFFSVLRE